MFCISSRKIPAHLAEKVAKSISIPVIGIGAGGGVDGQVLVIHDMLGMNNEVLVSEKVYESIRRNDDCYWSICCRCKIE
jgi:ketopantoate hydroxymethyltransferase